MALRIDFRTLTTASRQALAAAGLEAGYADIVAETLVEADLMGHHTHGVALLPKYLAELAQGTMTPAGAPNILRDSGNSAAWDGRFLPGPVLVRQALEHAASGAGHYGVATVAIGQSHHIACLAAYLKAMTDRGLAAIIATSSPSSSSVTPFGGCEGVLSPNPLAAGWPTEGEPVILDISASITTNNFVESAAAAGKRLPGQWIIGPDGVPSDDPGLLSTDPKGALLPTGGTDHGHKGYALALLIEMLTSGLAGNGRVEQPTRWGSSVFVMVIDPAHHGGQAAFIRETGKVAELCRNARGLRGEAVRVPGQRGLALRTERMAKGIPFDAPALERLRACCPGV